MHTNNDAALQVGYDQYSVCNGIRMMQNFSNNWIAKKITTIKVIPMSVKLAQESTTAEQLQTKYTHPH
jgi:hypothetical protein